MADTHRDKVLQAFELYFEGGTIKRAIAAVKMSHATFYQTLVDNPDLLAKYREIQQSRADMMVDEVYAIGEGEIGDPRAAQVAITARTTVAGFYDRRRFGQKVALEIETGPNLLAALTERQRELLRPAQPKAIDVDATPVDPDEADIFR